MAMLRVFNNLVRTLRAALLSALRSRRSAVGAGAGPTKPAGTIPAQAKHPSKASNMKRTVLNEALSQYRYVFVAVMPSPGMGLPDGLPTQRDGTVVLQLSRDLTIPVPMRDLVLDSEGVAVTLSFNRKPVPVRIPWSRLVCVAADDFRCGFLYDLAAPRIGTHPTMLPPPPAAARRRAHLRLVDPPPRVLPPAAPLNLSPDPMAG